MLVRVTQLSSLAKMTRMRFAFGLVFFLGLERTSESILCGFCKVLVSTPLERASPSIPQKGGRFGRDREALMLIWRIIL